jgi:hypothetical protein
VTHGGTVTYNGALVATICASPRPTFETSKWNTYNIRLKQMKHLKHDCIAIVTCATQDLHLKHLDEIFATSVWNRWNTWSMCLKHVCIAIATCVTPRSILKHPDETFAIYIWITWTLKTYACNMRILSLQHVQHPNLPLQHPDLVLQHQYKTLVKYLRNTWNIRLQHALSAQTSPCCFINGGLSARGGHWCAHW